MMLRQGDLVLVPVPFTDLSASKKRPAIVGSNDGYNAAVQDMVVVSLTSNPNVTSYSFAIETKDLTVGSLRRPGRVRVDKIFALDQSTAVRQIGTVKQHVLDSVRAVLEQLLKDKSGTKP